MKKGNENARFLSRFLAFIIDMFIVIFVASIISAPFMIDKIENINKIDVQMEEVIQKYTNQEIDIKTYVSEAASLTYQSAKYQGIQMLILILIEILYFIVYQYYRNGQTIGKKIMKIKLVSQNGNLSMNQVLMRSLLVDSILLGLIQVLVVSLASDSMSYMVIEGSFEFIIYMFIVISAFMIMFTKERKGLHDYIVKTKVINV